MRHTIVLAPGAVAELRSLHADERARVRSALERYLRHEPTRTSKSRIKKLRGLRRPQYRLRVGEVRIFYDVRGRAVEVLAIVSKEQAGEWLEQQGEAE